MIPRSLARSQPQAASQGPRSLLLLRSPNTMVNLTTNSLPLVPGCFRYLSALAFGLFVRSLARPPEWLAGWNSAETRRPPPTLVRSQPTPVPPLRRPAQAERRAARGGRLERNASAGCTCWGWSLRADSGSGLSQIRYRRQLWLRPP